VKRRLARTSSTRVTWQVLWSNRACSLRESRLRGNGVNSRDRTHDRILSRFSAPPFVVVLRSAKHAGASLGYTEFSNEVQGARDPIGALMTTSNCLRRLLLWLGAALLVLCSAVVLWKCYRAYGMVEESNCYGTMNVVSTQLLFYHQLQGAFPPATGKGVGSEWHCRI
jgi:hypothetical protein